MTPNAQFIRCSVSSCSCVCYTPGKVQLRSCDLCGHGWVEHALEKFQAYPPSNSGPVEVALPGLVFDLSSLVLFGAQAIPVQLKILLDRLYSILTPGQVGQILNSLGWSLSDYVRGYMLQHPSGKVLNRWSMTTSKEEQLILKQFVRFGETRPMAELMILQHMKDENLLRVEESIDPGENVQLTNKRPTAFNRSSLSDSDCHENVQGGKSIVLPFHFPKSAIYCSTKNIAPSTHIKNILQDYGGNNLVQKHDHEKYGSAEDNLVQKTSESALSVKSDPDKSNPPLWHHDPILHYDHSLLQKQFLHQEKTASPPSTFNFSFLPSLLYSSIPSSSSPQLQHPPKSQTLPSLPSSFPKPLHSTFSSPLHHIPSPCSSLKPLSSSLCTLPCLPSLLAVGGRKGRVSCGVCGKSFYDKGTLKIHYNAVHLKIKHRCTVMGCAMVFSSLRSRNRHSVNPNPRLHTGGNREGPSSGNTVYRKGCVPTAMYEVHQETQTLVEANRDHETTSPAPPLVQPAPSLGGFSSSCTDLQTSQQWWQSNHSLTKKKPRKSTMPVKIERKT